jgi:hypothetical protein
MYYHMHMANMRICGCAAALTALLVLPQLAQAQRYPTPQLRPETTQSRDQGITPTADWYGERTIEGIGWKIGTVSRGDGSVMDGGYTVIKPLHREPIVLLNCYVLAAFDLLPRGVLLVCVRDPEHYWPGYDYKDGVTDPLELVWLDEDWREQYSIVLDYAAGEYPDDFQLAPKENYLLAIRHPLNSDGKLAPAGQSLSLIYLSDGSIVDVPLPETDGAGQLPAAWWPVLMEWNAKGQLVVQAGEELRTYSIEW